MTLSTILFLLFFFSLATLAHQRTHILMTLLSLEFLVLTLAMLSLNHLSTSTHLHTFSFSIILTFGAIEASLGLAMLISLTRQTGTDLITALTMSKC